MPLHKTLQPTRVTLGDDGRYGKKGIISVALNKFDLRTPKAANATAVNGAVAASSTGATNTVFATPVELKQPRSVSVTFTGTAASVAATPVVVSGLNFEGKPMTDSITPTAATLGTYNGTKAFAVVTSVNVPQQGGTGVSVSVGTGNNFGLSTCNLSVTQVRLYKQVIASGAQSLVAPGSTNFSTTNVEDNWVTLDVTPSGLSRYRVYAFNYNWHLNPVNDLPVYGV